jgi:circadian clock protein KaiB
MFVTGSEPNSLAAQQNLEKLRESAPHCDIECELLDVLEHFHVALEHNVLVTPCLVLVDPPPRAVIVGTLRDLAKVRAALRIGQDAAAYV